MLAVPALQDYLCLKHQDLQDHFFVKAYSKLLFAAVLIAAYSSVLLSRSRGDLFVSQQGLEYGRCSIPFPKEIIKDFP